MTSSDDAGHRSLVIRHMERSDIDRVVALERQLFTDPWPESAFIEQLSGRGWGAEVAVWDSEVIGYSCYFVVDTETHLTNLAVVPAFRRKSVAKRLLDSILHRARQARCEYVILEVRPSNTEALAFYEKHGFTLLYQRPNYYRHPVEDALVMVRYLGRHKE